MKHPILLGLCWLLPFVFGACERHSWQETKKLREHGNGARTTGHGEPDGVRGASSNHAAGAQGGENDAKHGH